MKVIDFTVTLFEREHALVPALKITESPLEGMTSVLQFAPVFQKPSAPPPSHSTPAGFSSLCFAGWTTPIFAYVVVISEVKSPIMRLSLATRFATLALRM